MELVYDIELDNIYEIIGNSKIMALATSINDKPTVRLVSCITYNNKIFFQTGTDLKKYEHILNNKNVALCFDNIQIEGIANIIGKTRDKENNEIMEIYKSYYKSSYETYSHMDKEILVEIIPEEIIKWDYEEGKPYRIFINIKAKLIKKEMYL
jgi:uncharacterized pyridoxamine 5'-phosphate oxidase family protein